jgi:hypothetical protein
MIGVAARGGGGWSPRGARFDSDAVELVAVLRGGQAATRDVHRLLNDERQTGPRREQGTGRLPSAR